MDGVLFILFSLGLGVGFSVFPDSSFLSTSSRLGDPASEIQTSVDSRSRGDEDRVAYADLFRGFLFLLFLHFE